MLGLLAYISVAGAWFWARSLHPAIVTWPTRIATGTRWRRKPVSRGGVHPSWRHAAQPQERACRQGCGAALPLAGMTGHQRLVRAGATKAAKGDAELLTPALGPSRDDTHCRTAERFASALAGDMRCVVCAGATRHAHAGGGRENMQGVGEEELSAQDCAPGPGPRYSDLCDVKNVSRAAGQHIICR